MRIAGFRRVYDRYNLSLSSQLSASGKQKALTLNEHLNQRAAHKPANGLGARTPAPHLWQFTSLPTALHLRVPLFELDSNGIYAEP